MAVSLAQVQAAISNFNPASASGPLTLNVLHKTDALLAKLLALDPNKPQSLQVLNAQTNGRAQVQLGQLTLDVKASIPLKAGEVFQLKFEQVGSALRFVQPVGQSATGQEAAVKGANVQTGAAVNGAVLSGKTGVPGGAVHVQTQDPSRLQTAQVTQQTTQQNGGQNLAQGRVATHIPTGQNGQPLTINTAPANTALPPGSGTPPGIVSAKALPGGPPLTTVTGTPAAGSLGAATPVGPTLSVSPLLATQTTTTALIRAVAEALPEVTKRADGRAGDKSIASKGGHLARGVDGGQSAIAGARALATAEQVNASYKFAGQKGIEEIQEIKGLPQRPADISLELPLLEGQKPVLVSLYLDREPHQNEDGDDEKGYGVRFSMETEETGVVHTEMSLRGEMVRLGMWAERADIAILINESLPILEDRLLATGFKVAGIFVRQGIAPAQELMDQSHVDEEI